MQTSWFRKTHAHSFTVFRWTIVHASCTVPILISFLVRRFFFTSFCFIFSFFFFIYFEFQNLEWIQVFLRFRLAHTYWLRPGERNVDLWRAGYCYDQTHFLLSWCWFHFENDENSLHNNCSEYNCLHWKTKLLASIFIGPGYFNYKFFLLISNRHWRYEIDYAREVIGNSSLESKKYLKLKHNNIEFATDPLKQFLGFLKRNYGNGFSMKNLCG